VLSPCGILPLSALFPSFSPPPSLLPPPPLPLSLLHSQPAEEDIPASEESKKKTKPKGTKKEKTKKPKGQTDEELFGNTDDIFGDLPPAATTKSPKTKKKKKTMEQSVTATTAVTDGATEESKSFKFEVIEWLTLPHDDVYVHHCPVMSVAFGDIIAPCPVMTS